MHLVSYEEVCRRHGGSTWAKCTFPNDAIVVKLEHFKQSDLSDLNYWAFENDLGDLFNLIIQLQLTHTFLYNCR